MKSKYTLHIDLYYALEHAYDVRYLGTYTILRENEQNLRW